MKLNITTKLLSLFVIAALTLTSCGDDKDDVTPGNPGTGPDLGCKLTEVDSDGNISTIEYNNKGYVTKVDYSDEEYEEYTLYKYDGQNRMVREEEWEDGELIEYAEYTYTSGRVSKLEWFDADGTSDGAVTFKYDGNNRMIEMTEVYEYEEDGEVVTETYTAKHTYNDADNVTTTVFYYNDEEDFRITYEGYDNKHTPFAALKGLFNPWSNASANNPGKATSSYTWEGEEYTSVTTYSYSYNSKNLPTRITQTDEEGDTNVSNFTYQCN